MVLEPSCERQSLSETLTVGAIGKQEAFGNNLMKKGMHLSEAGPNLLLLRSTWFGKIECFAKETLNCDTFQRLNSAWLKLGYNSPL